MRASSLEKSNHVSPPPASSAAAAASLIIAIYLGHYNDGEWMRLAGPPPRLPPAFGKAILSSSEPSPSEEVDLQDGYLI